MGQSLVKQYTHIIFSTKHQHPFIINSVGCMDFAPSGLTVSGDAIIHRATPCAIDIALSGLNKRGHSKYKAPKERNQQHRA